MSPRIGPPALVLLHWLACALWASMPLAVASAAPQRVSQPVQEELLTSFYKDARPERLVGFLDDFQRSPSSQRWNAYPPLVGFLAVIFRNHPDWIDRLTPAQPNANIVETVAAALRLAGDPRRAEGLQAKFAKMDAHTRLKSELSGLPTRLEDLRVVSATHLDILWGAAFASGDERYVRPIIDFAAQTANRSEPIAIDVARSTVALAGGPKEIWSELKSKHGDALAREIIVASVALWALRSNAARHPFVERAATKYVEDNADTPIAKAIAALRPKPKPL